MEAPALQDEAWTCLFYLGTQVQLMQSSLTHHMTELSTLCQTINLIFQSLQALLECLNTSSAPPMAVDASPPATAPVPAALVTLQPQIPCPVLLDTYDGACSGGEQFLQSCLTYIHLSRDTVDSNALKIAWVLSYMKTGCASTYALQVFCHCGGVGSFLDWTAFEKDFHMEFFPLDPAKMAALMLCNREQYG
ncbi:hypothetical protein C0989_005783 [Termitomyces sp. Mn162]|nr:hypothetical protein C0989_005783 [Termitomyces sp. Mn162]